MILKPGDSSKLLKRVIIIMMYDDDDENYDICYGGYPFSKLIPRITMACPLPTAGQLSEGSG